MDTRDHESGPDNTRQSAQAGGTAGHDAHDGHHHHDHGHHAHDHAGHHHGAHADGRGHDHAGHTAGDHGHGHAHGHGHGHDHGHGHGHFGHNHGPVRHDRAFAIGAGVNLIFALTEGGFGFATNSVALIADATHNMGDVLGLLLGWMAVWLHRRPPSARRTYGWGRFSIAAALMNAAILLVSVGAIMIEALHRLHDPAPIEAGTVMLIATLGIVINGGSALLFLHGREADLNIRAQYLHLAGDAAVSLGVVVAAFGMRLTGWTWLDPVTSLAIAAIIAAGTWSALREAAAMAMDSVPASVSLPAVDAFLRGQPGVVEVHDLHIWALSTTETALTAHLVFGTGVVDVRPSELAAALRLRFGIGHATVQIESGADADLCKLRPADIV